MTDQNQKSNPLNTPQEHDKLVLDLKTEIQTWKDKAEEWRLGKVKVEQEKFQEERKNTRLAEEVEELRQADLRQRTIQLDKQETKQGNEFLDQLTAKLDAKIQAKQTK